MNEIKYQERKIFFENQDTFSHIRSTNSLERLPVVCVWGGPSVVLVS